MKPDSAFGMCIASPVVHFGTKRDNRRVEGIGCVPEAELAAGVPNLLSEIIQQCIIAVPEESAGTVLVLISKVRLRRGARDAKVIQIPVGGMETVAYLTQRNAIGKLAEYHAHQMAPCVETLGMFVRTVLSYQGFYQIFRQLLNDLGEKCYLCHEGGLFCLQPLRYIFYIVENYLLHFYLGHYWAIPHIYFKDYSKAKIFCLSYSKQLRYAKMLEAIDAKLLIEQKVFISLNSQKQYLLRLMFI